VRRYIIMWIFAVGLLLTACGPSTETDSTKETTKPTKEPGPALPTLDTSLVVTAYPAPSDSDSAVSPPESVDEPTGYPEPVLPSETPTPYAYPEGTKFWLRHPAGIQCEDMVYPTLEDATAALEKNGVPVLQAEEVNMIVCEACNCPTSEQYRVFIDANYLEAALDLGWVRE